MSQNKKAYTCSLLNADYTLTGSLVTVPGFSVVAPKTAYYTINCCFCFLANAATDDCITAFYVNGNRVNGTYSTAYGSGASYFPVSKTKDKVYIKKGQIVEVKAGYNAAAGGVISKAAYTEGYLEITEE